MRTLQTELVDKGLYPKRNRKRNRKTTTQSKTNNEKLSRREWEELMGIRKPRYSRNRGAYRQH